MITRTIGFFCFAFAMCVTATAQTEPVLTSASIPKYPALALSVRVEGVVKVSFTLGPLSGEPTKVEVVSGHQLLKDAALENVKTWHFRNSSTAERSYETTLDYRITIGQKSKVCFESFQTVEIRAGEVPVIED